VPQARVLAIDESTRSSSEDADSSDNRFPAHRVSVLCVDEQGNPVEGAEVHLFQNVGKGPTARYFSLGAAKSDAQGKAFFPRAIFSDSLGNFDRWVYARVPGKFVGVARSVRWLGSRIINPEARVKMMPSRSVDGIVTVPAGVDPRTVTVVVRVMHVTTGDGDFEFESFPREDSFPGLNTSLPDIFETTADAKGKFRFHDMPVHGHLYLITAGPGLGEAQWRNDWKQKSFDAPSQIDIQKEKKLLGRVLSPTGEPVSGAEVLARIMPTLAGSAVYLSTFRALTDAAGEFEIKGLPDIEFVVSVRDAGNRWVIRPKENVKGIEETDPGMTLKMEAGVLISGRVLDENGNAVEGAALSALADTQGGPGLDDDVTDHNGSYQLRIPSGGTKFYFNGLPDGFEYPDPQIVKQLNIEPMQAEIRDLNFTLQRKTKN